MTRAQKKVVADYRKRQEERGFVRLEVNVPEGDRPLIRQVAASLRSGGPAAEKVRAALAAAVNPFEGMDLKELLENSPLDELDLERSQETWRAIDL